MLRLSHLLNEDELAPSTTVHNAARSRTAVTQAHREAPSHFAMTRDKSERSARGSEINPSIGVQRQINAGLSPTVRHAIQVLKTPACLFQPRIQPCKRRMQPICIRTVCWAICDRYVKKPIKEAQYASTSHLNRDCKRSTGLKGPLDRDESNTRIIGIFTEFRHCVQWYCWYFN